MRVPHIVHSRQSSPSTPPCLRLVETVTLPHCPVPGILLNAWCCMIVFKKKKTVGAGSRSLRLSGLLCKLSLHGPHSLHTGDKGHLLLKHKANTQRTFSQSLHKARQHGGILSFTGTMLFSTEREPTCSSWTSRG